MRGFEKSVSERRRARAGNVNVCNFQEFCPKTYLSKFRLCVGVNHFAIASVLLNIPLLQEV